MFNFAVIGAGIVGLTLARKISLENPDSKVLILESNPKVGDEATSHNSGVVHAGIYYEAKSLRAELCRKGGHKLQAFCEQHDISIRYPGKLVVASGEVQLTRLRKLFENANLSGAKVSWVTKDEITNTETRVRGDAGIFSPRSGIVDYKQVAEALASELNHRGASIFNERKISEIKRMRDGSIRISADTGEDFIATNVFVAAGHSTLRLAQKHGIGQNLASLYFKGVYRHLTAPVSDRLIYPTPNPKYPFLGVHITNHIDGKSSLGPNSQISLLRSVHSRQGKSGLSEAKKALEFGFRNPLFSMKEIALSMSGKHYLEELRKFVPDAERTLLEGESFYGIRHQIVDEKSALVKDYVFHRQHNMVFLIGTPSPAATSAFAIADYVYQMFTDGEGEEIQ